MSFGGDPSDANFLKVLDLIWSGDHEYVLRQTAFFPYYSGLEGLNLAATALKDSFFALNAGSAKMSAAAVTSGWSSNDYEQAQRHTAAALLTFCALHSGFIDSSRALREKAFGKNNNPVRKALGKIFAPVASEHVFLKDLRNCQLHHRLQPPNLRIQNSEYGETVHLHLDRNALLASGWEWKKPSRDFMRNVPKNEVDLISLSRKVLRNIDKQVEFHFRAISRSRALDRDLFLQYKNAIAHAQAKQSDRMAKAFKLDKHWKKTS
jgi:hypothetical protein